METRSASLRRLQADQGEKYCDEENNVTESPPEGAKFDHKTLMVVFFGLVLDLLAFTMILPLLPALLDYYGQNSEDTFYRTLKDSVRSFRELVGAPDTPRWNSVLFGGMIGSLFSLLQFLASPIVGAASDVYGRKPLMIVSMVGIALSYAVWAISHNFALFVFARVIGGISKGNVSLSTAIVTDICPREKRGRGMAAVGAAFSVGFLIGPLIGAFFSRQVRASETFFTAPAMFALLLALVDIAFLLFFLKETLPKHKRAASLGSGLRGVSSLLSPMALFRFEAVNGASPKDLKAMRTIGVAYFIYLFLYSGLEFTLTFLTHNRFNYDSLQQGKMFFLIGIIMVLIQGGFVRRIKAGQEIHISIVAICTLMPAFIIVGYAATQFFFYCGLVLFAFASATVVPCLTTMASSYGGVEQKGTVLGIFRSLGALARAFGPIVSSTLYWSLDASSSYLIGTVGFVVPIVLLYRLSKVRTA